MQNENLPKNDNFDNDDEQIGRILGRREVLALFGAAGAAMLLGRAPRASGFSSDPRVAAQATSTPEYFQYLPVVARSEVTPTLTPTATPSPTPNTTPVPACVVRPAVTEGPYFVDEKLNRSDIRSDPGTGVVKAGSLLALNFNVSRVSSGICTTLSGATVDVWHCDAAGVYSDVSEAGFNTLGQKFLRGYQVTDANGVAAFTTIYPGWYSGRAVHIHFKIRLDPNYEFTSQLFFADSLSDQVFTVAPYASKGQRNTLNSNDNIYNAQLLLTVTQTAQGYAATFNIGLNI